MADVFISYHENANTENIVRRIAEKLEESGISCWYAGRDSLPGFYAKDIGQEIQSCKVFLLILNEEANQSRDVLSEVSFAFNHDVTILPFRVDDCALDDDLLYYLAVFTVANGNPPNAQNIGDLTKRIRNLLARTAPKAKAQTETKRLSGF